MKFRDILRRALPYVVAVAVFGAVSAIYFAPQFSGKTLSQTDVQMYDGMKKDISEHRAEYGEDPQWTGGMFSGMPAYQISVQYPAMILRNGGQWVLNLMGEPAALMFLAMLGFWVMLLLTGVGPWVAIVPAIAYGLSTYNILIIEAGHITKMRAIGWAPMLVGAVWWTFRRNAWVGGALAALFGALTIGAAHPQITYYFLMVIIALWINEFVCTLRDKGWGADVVKAGEGVRPRAMGQIGKFSPLGSVKLFSIRKGWDKFWLATGVLVAAAILAVGANFTHLWYTFEHSGDTTRGGSEIAAEAAGKADGSGAGAGSQGLDLQYATAWSYGIGESMNMLIPNLRGGASSGGFEARGEVANALRRNGYDPSEAIMLPSYWGDQPGTGGPTYIGAVVVFLFVLGLFVLPGRQKWWIVGVSAVGLLMAWGSNIMWFTQLAFDLLPGYNKFRAVATALVILQWSVPFVAALTMKALWNNELDREKFKRGFLWALGLTGGVALLFALIGGAIYDFAAPVDEQLTGVQGLVEAMRSERAAMLRADSWRSFFFVALTAGVVWMWRLASANKLSIRRGWLLAALGVLVVCDLVPVGMRYLSHDDFRARERVEVTPDEADRAIMADPEPGFRVLNTENPFNEAYTSYFHRSVGGYHGAKLSRYQDVIEQYLAEFDLEVFNMLNTKYFIFANPETGRREVEQNLNANGAAWFVEEVVRANGAREELEALGVIDNKRQAVVDANYELRTDAKPRAIELAQMAEALRRKTQSITNYELTENSIRLVEYRPNYLRYESSSAEEGLAVFSEIYYDKGWTAYIDGEETPYLRADYILRAMVVPAGKHTIEWRFRAPRFATMEGVTLGCSIAILLWLVAAILYKILCDKKISA